MARTKLDSSLNAHGKHIAKTSGKRLVKSTVLLSAEKKKFKPGTVALREIRKYQKSTSLLIKCRPFHRLIRSTVQIVSPDNTLKFQKASLSVLQEATENFLVGMLEDSYRCAIHAKRVTLLPRDILLIYKIKHAGMMTTPMF